MMDLKNFESSVRSHELTLKFQIVGSLDSLVRVGLDLDDAGVIGGRGVQS